MAQLLGKNAVVLVGAGPTNISAYCNTSDLQRLNDLLESHTYGDNAKETVPGLSDATVKMSGFYTDTATEIDAELNTLFAAGTGTAFEYRPAGTGSGKVKFTGTVFVRNYQIGAPVGGLETWSADLQFSGGCTRGTQA